MRLDHGIGQFSKYLGKRPKGAVGMAIAKTAPDDASYKPLVSEFIDAATIKRVIYTGGGSIFSSPRKESRK